MNYKILALTFGLAGYTMATPIKTIPWNGHVGAVSFTFDDALICTVLDDSVLIDNVCTIKDAVNIALAGNVLYLPTAEVIVGSEYICSIPGNGRHQ